MMLYTFTVILFIGIAGIFSNCYNNFVYEIFLGLLAPILVGYGTVFFMKKYSKKRVTNYILKLVRFYIRK